MKKPLFLILLLGLILRLISLNQSFWLDEATTSYAASQLSFSGIITKFSPADFHPPLYYLVLRGWSMVFGFSEVSLRIPSVIFGVATIYVVYLIAKEIECKFPEVAAALLATSGLHIYYSQEARMYGMVTLLVSFLVYSFLKEKWVLFSTLLVLIAMTDYPALLVIPIFWILGRKNWKRLAISHLPLAIYCFFWYPVFIKQFSSGLAVRTSAEGWWKVLGKTSLKELLLIPTKFIFGRISLVNKTIYALLVSVVGLVYAYILFLVKPIKRYKLNLVWVWFMIPILAVAVLGLKVSVFSYFRLIFVLPAFFLLLALGIGKLKEPWFKFVLGFVLVVNILSTGAYLFNPRFQRENWRDLVSFIDKESKGFSSITLFVADSNMEAYRYYDSNAKISGPEGLNNGFDQIWLMRYVQPIFDPEDKVRAQVEKMNYIKQAEYDFNGVVVWKYKK
ncbi:MAG: glycosyltransferase family 39 protein [bacterium]